MLIGSNRGLVATEVDGRMLRMRDKSVIPGCAKQCSVGRGRRDLTWSEVAVAGRGIAGMDEAPVLERGSVVGVYCAHGTVSAAGIQAK